MRKLDRDRRVERVSETIKYIKNFNIGDSVTSTTSILLDRGFRGVTGTIRTIVKDEADSWQYIIDLDDGRELQCDDWHLDQPTLNENQQIVIDLEMTDCYVEVAGWNFPEELDTENLRYLFSNVLENERALEQEEER
jgi:ribosomal protein L21E